jgi:hypothetical protein
MKVSVKDFGTPVAVKNRGVEFAIYDENGHVGDLIVNKRGLRWGQGRTGRRRSKLLTWPQFAARLNNEK